MRSPALWLVVLAAALAYPLAVLAGGWPSFPTRDDCGRPAVDGAEIDAVFGRFDTLEEGNELRDRAVALGLTGTVVERDACGNVLVVQHGIPTLEVGEEFAEEAASVGLEVTLQRAG
jgi:hypothetical protein